MMIKPRGGAASGADMTQLRLRLLLVAVAFCLFASPVLTQPHQDPDAQKAEQPQAVEPDAKPERPLALANEAKHGTENREKHEERCEYRGPVWFADFYCFFALHDKFWVAFGTLILAAGTAVLGFATVFLWRATRDLVRDAKATGAEQLKISVTAAEAVAKAASAAIRSAAAAETSARLAEENQVALRRARLFLETIKVEGIKNPLGAPYAYKFRFVMRNVGITPARRACNFIVHDRFDEELPDDFAFPDGIKGKIRYKYGTIGPGLFQELQIIVDIQNLIDAFYSRTHLYIWGWIEYSDVFPNTPRHRTEFCSRVVVIGDPTVSPDPRNFAFPSHWKFNGADEDCEHEAKTVA